MLFLVTRGEGGVGVWRGSKSDHVQVDHVISDGRFALRKVEARLYGGLESEFQTHEVGIVPNF